MLIVSRVRLLLDRHLLVRVVLVPQVGDGADDAVVVLALNVRNGAAGVAAATAATALGTPSASRHRRGDG